MTRVERWLLPDGIEEILPPKAERIEQLRAALLETVGLWGYDLVNPPALEYLDSLLTGVGKDLDLRTFKVTDQLSGRMMGLSADMTPQVARIDAHSLAESGVSRLSYCRTVFHTKAASLLASRTPMQLGAELFGDDSLNADMEVIELMLALLEKACVRDVHLSLGTAHIARQLAAFVGIDDEQRQRWFELLDLKCLSDLDAWVDADVSANHAHLLKAFARLQGDVSVLNKALEITGDVKGAKAAIERLQHVVARLQTRYPDLALTIDLTELRGHQYHTGLIFSAFVPGFGEALVNGGRYDETGSAFGRARPAIGFSADLKCIESVSQFERQKCACVIAPNDDDPALWSTIQTLREQGKRVVVDLDQNASRRGDYRLEHLDGQWQLVASTDKDQ